MKNILRGNKMLFGFFFRSERTLFLSQKPNLSISLPNYCSRESSLYPHILTETNKIYPIIKNLDFKCNHIHTFTPLFFIIGENNKFFLLLYPNTNIKSSDTLVNEYVQSIQLMALCGNISGYYLGLLDDPNVLYFQYCDEANHEFWISEVNPPITEFKFHYEHSTFSTEKLYIQKIKL